MAAAFPHLEHRCGSVSHGGGFAAGQAAADLADLDVSGRAAPRRFHRPPTMTGYTPRRPSPPEQVDHREGKAIVRAADNDRLAALRQLSPADVAELLRDVPDVAQALAGTGPLAPLDFSAGRYARGPLPATMPALARLLGSRAGIRATLATLDRFHLQLVTLAKWHGGTLTRDQALAEAGEANGEALESAAQRLARLLLADRSRAWLELRAGVADVVGLPGVPARPTLQHMGSEQLADRLRRLGQSPPGRKRERLDALEACLRHTATVTGVLAGAPADVRRLLQLLIAYGPQHLSDLGQSLYYLPADSPLAWLLDHSLAVLDGNDMVHVWLDVLVAMRGRLHPEWEPTPPAVASRPLAATAPQLPPVLSQLAALLDLWSRDPAPALRAGGLGVRPVRAAAKTLGLPAGTVGLLAHLAISMGLLGTVETGASGRGRNRRVDLAYAPTPLAAAFAARPATERWVRLVAAWRDDRRLDEAGGLPERSASGDLAAVAADARRALLDALRRLPEDRGATVDELVALAAFHHPSLPTGDCAGGVVDGARALGLVPPDGPIGLTALGRAALQGVDAVEAALPPPSTTFTVQADHTVVAPPDLDPALTATLERYAVCESDAGARIYRLGETRLAAALDDGDTAETIVAFLCDHATAPVARNVTQLIEDVARRHGRVRAGSCHSYLRSDDPSLLARAVAVNAAKLRTVAPTVAVSSLPRAKLVGALRAKGLMPVAEDADGVAITEAPTVGASAWDVDDALPEMAAEPAEPDVEALAKRLLDHPDDDTDRRGSPLLLPGAEMLWT